MMMMTFSFTFFGQNGTDSYFVIKLGKFSEPKAEDFSDLKNLGYIYADELENNEFYVYVGGFGNMLDAQSKVDEIKKLNFKNAVVEPRPSNKGKDVSVVQLAIFGAQESIDWSQLEAAGKLYTATEDENVRVITGIYKDAVSATKRAEALHANGFHNAYVINLNSSKLHFVSSFDKAASAIKPAAIVSGLSPEKDVFTAKGGPALESTTAPPAARLIPRSDPPSINQNIKRQSVKLLQKVLNSLKAYPSEADGVYSAETANAYNGQFVENAKLKNYQTITNSTSDKITGYYMDWKEVKLLKTIANDLSPNDISYNDEDLQSLVWYHKRASVLSKEDVQKVENWDFKIRKGLDALELKDDLYKEMATAFKLTYFQTQVLLEDYFMNKGFNLNQSRILALGALNAILDGSMDVFL